MVWRIRMHSPCMECVPAKWCLLLGNEEENVCVYVCPFSNFTHVDRIPLNPSPLWEGWWRYKGGCHLIGCFNWWPWLNGHSSCEAIGPTGIEPAQTLQMIATHFDLVILCHGVQDWWSHWQYKLGFNWFRCWFPPGQFVCSSVRSTSQR